MNSVIFTLLEKSKKLSIESDILYKKMMVALKKTLDSMESSAKVKKATKTLKIINNKSRETLKGIEKEISLSENMEIVVENNKWIIRECVPLVELPKNSPAVEELKLAINKVFAYKENDTNQENHDTTNKRESLLNVNKKLNSTSNTTKDKKIPIRKKGLLIRTKNMPQWKLSMKLEKILCISKGFSIIKNTIRESIIRTLTLLQSKKTISEDLAVFHRKGKSVVVVSAKRGSVKPFSVIPVKKKVLQKDSEGLCTDRPQSSSEFYVTAQARESTKVLS